MARVRVCDCCGSEHSVRFAIMDASGIRERHRYEYESTVELCESCLTSLAFHWGRLAKHEVTRGC